MVFHSKMQCDVRGIAYDFEKKIGRVDIAPDHCVDMRGCIDVFECIDENVKLIETFSGKEPDTSYHKSPTIKGAWSARQSKE